MELMFAVLILVLLQYTFFSFKVGGARMKYSIKAPATSGHPEFERHYRVHQNTLEQLIAFIPAMLIFGFMAAARGWPGYEIASAMGVLWIAGRFIYARSYVKDPDSRGLGFMLGFLASNIMMLGVLLCAALSVFD